MNIATARINLRVSEEARDVIDRAAEMQGVDRTAFMLDAAVTRARSVILEDAILNLTSREVEQVRSLIEAEAEPTPALRRAAQRLEQLGL
ncbi:uncharacterized protein (DUF1778 family) [Leucobacter exalbidus]|uniref:Uncharacterized protein (DUF1778 family) n=1 Tax=Leucobacter exalbidus TaxID=662960 RepID=A0A940PMG4_9MICO|nr:DUF1778 domain-containing protein [Leucobacter exalbidus]MBP1325810.1 uncharacterized protein (DUF1778 family) [Leucobacter exalbidus]